MEGAISSLAEPELAWTLWNGKVYVPRQPEKTPLFKVVRENLETFLQEAELRSPLGNGVPEFVEEEFHKFLTCGALAGGFARLKCEGCGHEKLVPFSCKGRCLCPSCAGRRMTERAIVRRRSLRELWRDLQLRSRRSRRSQ